MSRTANHNTDPIPKPTDGTAAESSSVMGRMTCGGHTMLNDDLVDTLAGERFPSRTPADSVGTEHAAKEFEIFSWPAGVKLEEVH